ncbi:hypothetical protein PLICRDRAFT_47009 [Plicaturopsis crispa FD-325 SS-3]|uniref:Pheromone n=1 Tax=Plicaturopsis crispa FD-325 SS-3 TaxID=944288 RepID=A0A0C9T6U0_PLICR|nr:hypothetical protein PLICRDRAFT_47009 [Plicaturopsis crispa FD-325 SS-3]
MDHFLTFDDVLAATNTPTTNTPLSDSSSEVCELSGETPPSDFDHSGSYSIGGFCVVA